MIYVDVYVPIIDKVYDFNLDENATVAILIDEIAEMLSQKEQSKISGDPYEIVLCLEEDSLVMPRNKTLSECGVHTGSRIIFA